MHYDDETQTLRAADDLHGGKKLPFYRFYMVREGTAVPTVWFSIVLIYGLFALKHGAESWAGYIGFLQNPVVVILNLITTAAALLHAKLVRAGAESRQRHHQRRKNGARAGD